MLTDQEIQHLQDRGEGFNVWTKIKIKDFGNGLSETVVSSHETFSELSEEEFLDSIIRTKRGEGDHEQSRKISAIRAKSRVRQLCKLLQVRYMVTLTLRNPVFDRNELNRLFKKLLTSF